jgi:hypothetical protein
MPPLPIVVRAVLASSLRGAPLDIQYRATVSNATAVSSQNVSEMSTSVVVEPEGQATASLVLGSSLSALFSIDFDTSDFSSKSPNKETILPAESFTERGTTTPLADATVNAAFEKSSNIKLEKTEELEYGSLAPDIYSVTAALKASAAIVSVFVLFLFGLWTGSLDVQRLKKAEAERRKSSSITKDEETPNFETPPKHCEPRTNLQLLQPEQLEPKQANTSILKTMQWDSIQGFPVVCPPYMKACNGGTLVLSIPSVPEGSTSASFESGIDGLGMSTLTRGPAVRLLAANFIAGEESLLEIRESSYNSECSVDGLTSPVLVFMNTQLELWIKASVSDCIAKHEPGEFSCFGAFRPVRNLDATKRRVFAFWPSAKPDEVQMDPIVPIMAASISSTGSHVELGALPSGQLIASAAILVNEECTHEQLTFSTKPGLDAAVAIAAILGLALLAP